MRHDEKLLVLLTDHARQSAGTLPLSVYIKHVLRLNSWLSVHKSLLQDKNPSESSRDHSGNKEADHSQNSSDHTVLSLNSNTYTLQGRNYFGDQGAISLWFWERCLVE